ncbi:MAG: Deoxyguanosinetriphosphate triphosphohydrolase, partial [Veillonella dispar DORA_11]
YTKLELKHRYPFVYIMEAADDIAYCMSDIADGIEKGIITEKEFLQAFRDEWINQFGDEVIPVQIPAENNLKGFKRDISIPWSIKVMDEAVERFISLDEQIFTGTAEGLISKNIGMGRVLDTIKRVSRRILYTSFEAESIELTGYAVITGILNKY